MVPELASRLTGSSELFNHGGRHVRSSVNFVTAHDGFTLVDLVCYNDKHNDANGEQNRDGSDNNNSWNCGIEGLTDDWGIASLRRRQQRNLLATLFLSQGTPMMLAGDEFGKSQNGNNNAYCQDSALTWIDWSSPSDPALHDFVAGLAYLRRNYRAFERERFFTGTMLPDGSRKDITWLRVDGTEMSQDDWHDAGRRVIGLLFGDESRAAGDHLFLMYLSAHDTDMVDRFAGGRPRLGTLSRYIGRSARQRVRAGAGREDAPPRSAVVRPVRNASRSAALMRPAHAYLAPALEHGRAWGFGLNLYAFRSKRNWGIGDFTDLRDFTFYAKAAGADVVGVNPLHALHYIEPEAASPYSPTSRYFLNPLYIDVERVPEFLETAPKAQALRERVASEPFARALAMLRDAENVAYGAAWRARSSPRSPNSMRCFASDAGPAATLFARTSSGAATAWSASPSTKP